MYIRSDGTLHATYSDLAGGWPGTGNINADPLFVDAASGDYRLQAESPCIDAGDPNSPPDADGTRADMGAPMGSYYPGAGGRVGLSLPSGRATVGDSVTTSISATADGIFSATLAFLVDPAIMLPDTAGGAPFIVSHAFEGHPGGYADWNTVGDTVFVALASDDSLALHDEVLAKLAFVVSPDAPIGMMVPLRWAASGTRLNGEEATLTDGEVITRHPRPGDVTADGTVSALDASRILQYVVHKPVDIDLGAADVTGEGEVWAYDASWVLRKTTDDVLFPIEGGGLARPSMAPRAFAWVEVANGWTLHIDDPTNIESGTLSLSVPLTETVTDVTGGILLEYNRVGTTLYVAFVREPSAVTEMLHVEFATPPALAPQFVEGRACGDIVLSITDLRPLPPEFSLSQNAPNPFNPRTVIRFGVPDAGSVRLAVYDVNGQHVRMLVDGPMQVGHHEAVWDGADALGREVSSGVYLYRLTSDEGTLVRRMLLVR